MGQRIKIRRDTSVNWASINPILQDGEFGYDSTLRLQKIGDGVTAWNSLPVLQGSIKILTALPYSQGVSNFQNTLNAIPSSVAVLLRCKAAVNGFQVGDITENVNRNAISIAASSTTISVLKIAANTLPTVIPKTGGAVAVAAGTVNWEFLIVAIA